MKTFTIRIKTSNGGQSKVEIQANTTNEAKQKFKTLYPGVKMLGMSGGK